LHRIVPHRTNHVFENTDGSAPYVWKRSHTMRKNVARIHHQFFMIEESVSEYVFEKESSWRSMREVRQFSLTCFVFSLALLRSLQCFRDIPECKTDLNLECAVDDVMFAGCYDLFAHLLRFFCEATLFTIVFERHSLMQLRRKTTMCNSWRVAWGNVRQFRSPASLFLWG
jgi:hypothetical protein